MSFYLILYILVSSLLLIIGFLYFIKNKGYKNSGYFLLSVFSIFLWLILYITSFITTYDKNILLIFSRIMYGLAILSMYSMLFFNYYYNKNLNKYNYNVLLFLLLFLFLLSGFSELIIEDMVYDKETQLYYEKYGILYSIYAILYLLFMPFYIIISYIKIKSLSLINKIRLKYITIGFGLFMGLEILFLSILPIYGIRLFEKEQVLFFIPFVGSIFYSTYRYNFLDTKILLGKIINFIFSLGISLFLVNLFKFYFSKLNGIFIEFWGISQNFGIIDLLLGILIFTILYNLLNKYIFGNNEYIKLTRKIGKIKKEISYKLSISSLNKYLNSIFKNTINSSYVNVKLLSEKGKNLEGLKSYFLRDISNNLFINDIVFIEENKHKFDYNLIKNEISDKTYLVFPLLNSKRDFIGILEIGYKFLKDIYTKEEVDILSDFSEFVAGHIKYIEIYSKINDLNLNLDKKIDEKTIVYNQLLNNQTEFISMASHEIKSPIGSCIFQLDYILDELKDKNISIDIIEKELKILNETLFKVGNLTNKIFSVQKYELDKIKLFKQELNFNTYIKENLDIFKKVNPKLELTIDVDKNIGFINLDKIQFTQVIDNLLQNAVKFSNCKYSKINFSAKQKKDLIYIEIEDNGKGFREEEAESLFLKYNSGDNYGVGIGLGLYLCKMIVEMHSGEIKAENSKKLGGAKIIIIIPKNHK